MHRRVGVRLAESLFISKERDTALYREMNLIASATSLTEERAPRERAEKKTRCQSRWVVFSICTDAV